jgi:hypothetical protein
MKKHLKFYALLVMVSIEVSISQTTLRQSNFKLIKNAQVSFDFDKFNLLTSFSIKNKMKCLAQCNQLASTCMMVILQSSNCSLYGSSVSPIEMISETTNELKLYKKVESACLNHQFFDGISCCMMF